MWSNLIFLTIIFGTFESSTAQSFPVPTIKIYNFASSDDSSRLFYTLLSEISVLEDYDPSEYPVPKDLGIAMIGEFPTNCSCPDLSKIHSVTNQFGQLKFERAENVTPDMVDHGLAGFLAPFPGYCGSDQIEVIEFYSPALKTFRYDTSNNIQSYLTDYKFLFRPVRVLGYAYYSSPNVWLSGTPPYIKQGVQSQFYKTISVKFEMVRVLKKGNQYSYAINQDIIKNLTESGWSLTGETRPGPVSSQNELEKIREICGADSLQKCRDTFDASSGLYRPINLDTMEMGSREDKGDCGYFLTSTSNCFSQAQAIYSYDVNYGSIQAMYVNYPSNTGGGSVGRASPYIFSLLKL
ncbi:Protein CBG10471 [Caenorhabditis briggsae]|uniref:Protein CBG10471 n=1 Tax=Caenorhabditis briggsae TaxID=6238 RepID=A8XBA7_CAEBR|nr:Protein CBG10471 [Caenorhabditis briggsae]CAP29887.2 Protein CBG10471 [Caenorhabditis briggsae]